MSTELKSYTIVPDSLYVERKADKQLHDIVEAMQRPGYVLVSRQMGKTNLLLRAKRKWENSEDLYVYIDMSNADETEKECFESLIDTAIDTHEETLSCVRERIEELRRINITKSPVQAHNEELRVLLGAVKGRLVFILDEIDSLTRSPFSDNIFSQIRSIYFSRVNYPVLNKLTYVLSGVVEPTEIIKNPKISPFNIGEKILLDDFSHNEYLTFLKQAGLLWLGEAVIERIYYWAAGNPRITWDICYELQHKEGFTLEDVDALVKQMYLTSFDKAPVDTIRTLVKDDRILRDALMQLAYGKGDVLSDKIKSRLYLAGIVNYSANEVKIKNRIIKDSLSVSWLQKLEEEDKGLLNYAIELYTKGNYIGSVEKFNSYLANNEFPANQAPFLCFYLGASNYHIRQFEESLKFLTLNPLTPEMSNDQYWHENLLVGVDHISLGHYAESLEYFSKVMEEETHDWIYYSAKLNSLAARLQIAKENNEDLQAIEQEYRQLVTSDDEAIGSDVKLFAAFQLAGLYGTERSTEAYEVYNSVLGFANEMVKPRFLLGKYNMATIDQRPAVLDEMVTSLECITAVNRSLDPDTNLEIDEDLLIRILCLIYSFKHDRWNEVKSKYMLLPYSYGDFLVRMFMQAFVSSHLYGRGSAMLVEELHDNIDSDEYNTSSESHLDIYKFNAFLNFTAEYAKEYIEAFFATDETIDSLGLVIVQSYAWSLMEKKDYHTLLNELSWVSNRYPTTFSHQDMVTRALFEYTLLMSSYRASDLKAALWYGKQILSYIDDEIVQATDRNKVNLTQVKEIAQTIVSDLMPRKPVRVDKKIGRNDKVKVRYVQTNQIVVKKYKQVESDLEKGLCILVEEKS
jgi:hypothetical protein